MHRQVSNNFALVRASSLYPSTLECDLRKLLDVKKIIAPQMFVPFRYCGINACRLNRDRDRRFFRLFTIDVDCSTELREFAFRGSEEMSNLKCDRRMRWIDFKDLVCNS